MEVSEPLMHFLKILISIIEISIIRKDVSYLYFVMLIIREYCQRTGKDKFIYRFGDRILRDSGSCRMIDYRSLYYLIPCVPVDFSKMNEAYECIATRIHCSVPTSNDTEQFANTAVVTVLPGVYNERLAISRLSIMFEAVNVDKDKRNTYDRCSANIIWHRDIFNSILPRTDEPAIHVGDDSGWPSKVHLIGFNIHHSTDGNDIWSGNCAAYCSGKYSAMLSNYLLRMGILI